MGCATPSSRSLGVLAPCGAVALLLLGGAATFSVAGYRATSPPAAAPSGALRSVAAARPQSVAPDSILAPGPLIAVSLAAAAGFALASGRALAPAGQRGGWGEVVSATLTRRSRTALRAKNYWEGEWICADCGYIYNERAFSSKFEDLQAGFKCPQCAAPRRRFARKLGDKIGTTLDGGDTPILIFSALSLVVVFAIVYYALQ